MTNSHIKLCESRVTFDLDGLALQFYGTQNLHWLVTKLSFDDHFTLIATSEGREGYNFGVSAIWVLFLRV